jgi:hypothetical protein
MAAALLLAANAPLRATSSAQNGVQRDFQKTVTLSGNQGVSLDHRFGKVQVHGESGHEVRISATIRVQDSNANDAQDFLQKIQIEVREESDGVHIRTI